ncbi:glycoside hydrolase family 1 protein [Gleimia hominis]|uniref:glycoside hydrolase family 1 protein n=1 Tax=Gleimia hominis TaxID=595468 RepID=UPI000C80E267|nr:family 1 glycosylhydrolase [Gleimia hominis]WIK63880.1 family 1 glycosylhydrolase [Gleimia hominis]
MTRIIEFPNDFRWGVATAAAQVEGAGREGGKGESIWDALCKRPGAILDKSDIQVACDHYHRMPEDVALMKDLNVGTYRFSVSWARVMPDGRSINAEGLDFYERLVDELRNAGIVPWLTLYHWDLPEVLQQAGGWVNRETSYLFADYAEAVFDRLCDKVPTWTTLNEPWCSSLLSYAAGIHAPAHTDPVEAVAAVHHLLLGHGLAMDRMRRMEKGRGIRREMGLTLNYTVAHPENPEDLKDVEAARRIDGLSVRLFTDPIFRASYPADVVEDMRSGSNADIETFVKEGDMDLISAPIDVLGVNFYNGQMVSGKNAPDTETAKLPPLGSDELVARPRVTRDEYGYAHASPNVGSEWVTGVSRGYPRTAMDWEVHADDLRILLKRIYKDYTEAAGTRIVITENGAAYDDHPDENGYVDDSNPAEGRLAYLRDHICAVKSAMDEGVDVAGYLVWSFLDNFEWALGYTKRFGIVRVDYETQKRIPKASALWYRDVIASNSVQIP